jgi:phytoene synthase
MNPRDDIVMKAVRDADPDRYLATLYAPEARRPALFALYAFNAEVAGIRDRIREALPGEVRLQWWHEVIDSGFDRSADGHPVAEALLRAIDDHHLPRAAFANYLEARMFDVFNDPMPSRGDLEGYCGETASAIIQMAAMILDPAAAASQTEVAGHAGCAQAITGLLRLLPLHRTRAQCYVPRDLLAAAGTTPEAFISERDAPASLRAVEAMIALASEHFAAFRIHAGALPAALRPAFLPVALTPAYLAKLSTADSSEVSALRRHWLLFRAASWGRWPLVVD